MVRVTMAVMARLDLGGSEQAAVGLRKLEVRMAARPCKLAVAAALSLAGLEQAMAELSAGDFE